MKDTTKEEIRKTLKNKKEVFGVKPESKPDGFSDVREACSKFFLSRGMDRNGFKYI